MNPPNLSPTFKNIDILALFTLYPRLSIFKSLKENSRHYISLPVNSAYASDICIHMCICAYANIIPNKTDKVIL